jgi:hypothetical protein
LQSSRPHTRQRTDDELYKIAVALLIVGGLCAAAVQGLHAQTKPPADVAVSISSMKESDGFKTGVVDKASPTVLAAAGGRYIIHRRSVTALDSALPLCSVSGCDARR